MPVNYEKLKEWSFSPVVQSVRKRDVQFYALSVGLGRDPSDEKELRFVYEHGLVVLPTMPAVIAQPGFWVDEPSLGLEDRKSGVSGKVVSLRVGLGGRRIIKKKKK